MSNQLPTTLQDMLEISNSRATYQNQARIALLKFQNACTITIRGSDFRIDQNLLAYLHQRVQVNAEHAILLDINQMPVAVDDLEEFFDDASMQYHEALNEYYEEVIRLRSSRKPEKMAEATE